MNNMKSHTTLTTVRPPATVAMILGTPAPKTTAHSKPPARQPDAMSAREDIRRRYETPFHNSWNHGGLNE